MAGRGGGHDGWRRILDTVVALVMAGIVVVIFSTTPAGDTFQRLFGWGDASLSEATEASESSTERNPDAKTPAEWLALIFGSGTADTEDGTDADAMDASQADSDPTVPDTNGNPAGPSGDDATIGDPQAWAEADGLLAAIPVAKAHPQDYDRDEQFGGWSNPDSLCGSATTRDLILARDLTDVTSDRECRVTSGTLADPYTGDVIDFTRGVGTSGAVQIDHVVALQDAWASGAYAWTQKQREAYANDPNVLLAVDGSENMSKGAGVDFDGDGRYAKQKTGMPDVWLPSNEDYRCDYVSLRVKVKSSYGLSMTRMEKTETEAFLASCLAG